MSRFTDEMYETAATSTHALVTGEPEHPQRQTWGRIHTVARHMAGGLAAAGVGPGDSVAVLAGLPTDIAPVCQAVWMRRGAITMLHQPTPRTDLEGWARDTEIVVRMIGAHAVVVGAPFEAAVPVLAAHGIGVVTVDDLRVAHPVAPLDAREDDVALQQLTSGSTGSPKAVRITHANLVTNAHAMVDRIKFDVDGDVMVSWLPLFHDMGMVGFLTLPMQFGAEIVSVTPLEFLRAPMLWAELLSRYRGTISAAPNFAYSMLARRLERAPDGAVDLSSVRCLLNGAEPVAADTLAALAAAGRRFGLDPSALAPTYGMAEVTLAVSLPSPGNGVVVDAVDPDLLEAVQHAVPSTRANARRMVTLGKFVADLEGRVVDADRRVLPARSVGEIEVRGPSVTRGYLTVDGPVAAQDPDGWLATGDIGYLTDDGLMVVCGRVKDVIIMGGRNVYPTDIERAALTVRGVRPGNAVAVRLDAGEKRESFAVAVETNAVDDPDEVHRIEHEVVHAVFSEIGVRPRTVAVLGPGSIPKTSSGKLRRTHSAALF